MRPDCVPPEESPLSPFRENPLKALGFQRSSWREREREREREKERGREREGEREGKMRVGERVIC
jgi:hypothetical protein